MNSTKYRQFLVKIKQQFHEKIKVNKVNSLSAQQVAQMLFFHIGEEPIILRQFLVKATGKFAITWDDLLRYLQEDISLQQTVQKLHLSPASASQIIESNLNDFSKLLKYVKQKQTNVIQSIQKISNDIGEHCFLVCLDKELVIFDYEKKQVVSSFCFSYRKMKEKIFEKDQQKRLFIEKMTHRKTEEYLDKVEVYPMKNKRTQTKKSFLFPERFLTNNIKASVRGSALSSQKSDNLVFRKTSQLTDSKKKQMSQFKIKNDDVNRIFQIFENASLQNSISIAHAFTQARSNFKKNIILDNYMLEKQKKQSSYGVMSDIFTKDFRKDLTKMRYDSLQLNRRRKILSIDKCSRSKYQQSGQKLQKSKQFFKQQSSKKSKNNNQSLFSEQHRLEIVYISTCDNFILVSLFNRQIRLLQLKKGLSTIKYDVLFEKQFKSVVTFLEIYKSSNKQYYRILVIIDRTQKGTSQDLKKSAGLNQESGMTQIEVYQLNENMQIKSKLFECSLDCSAIYHSALPFGGILYNQKGYFCLIELNGLSRQGEQRILLQTTLYNPENNYRVSINEVRAHQNNQSFYLCCNNGYIYLLDKISKRIKYHTYVSPNPILDIQLINRNNQLVSLSKNGNISIYSTLHLQKIYTYQSYHDVVNESKILMTSQDSFYVYSSRNFNPYMICCNEQKQFDMQKPIKMAKTRIKLRRSGKSIQKKQKAKVFKIINGKGGEGDFVALLLEYGEICFLDTNLKYIGSYHYLKIHSVVDILCNNAHQYVSILTNDNHIQVINLYTQNALFTVKITQNELEAINLKEMNTSFKDSLKLKRISKKNKETIIFNNFFKSDNPSLFLAVVTQANNVYHYSDKGAMNLSLNIEQRSGGQITSVQMIYAHQCLVLMMKKYLIVLHRQSYYKKCTIDVSDHQLMKIKKTMINNQQGLICIDQLCNLFLVDVHLRVVKIISSANFLIKKQFYLFNRHMVFLRTDEQTSKIILNHSQKQQLIRTETNQYFFTIIGNKVMRINKQNGNIAQFNFLISQFQQVII